MAVLHLLSRFPCQADSGDINNLFFPPVFSIPCPERRCPNHNSTHNLLSPFFLFSPFSFLPSPFSPPFSCFWISKLSDTCALRGLGDAVCACTWWHLKHVWYKFSTARKMFCLLTQHITRWSFDYALSMKRKIQFSAFLEIEQSSSFILRSASCLDKHTLLFQISRSVLVREISARHVLILDRSLMGMLLFGETNPSQVSLSSWEPHCVTVTETSCSVVKVRGETLLCHCKPCSFPIFYCSALTMAVLNYSLQNCTPGFGWFPLNIIYSPPPSPFLTFFMSSSDCPQGLLLLSHEQCFVTGKLLCSLVEMWHLTQRKATE